MRVLVCGGRDFADAAAVKAAMEMLKRHKTVSLVIHGAATGADRLAAQWAEEAGVETMAFPADWKTHGRAAGPIRNRRMLTEGKPDGVVAFPGGRGTADMIAAAKTAGLKVWQPCKPRAR